MLILEMIFQLFFLVFSYICEKQQKTLYCPEVVEIIITDALINSLKRVRTSPSLGGGRSWVAHSIKMTNI